MNKADRSSTQQPIRVTERRGTRKNRIKILVRLLCAAGWALYALFFYFFAAAMPEGDDFFSRLLGYAVRYTWDAPKLRLAFLTLFAAFALAWLSFFTNLRIQRRRTDRFFAPSVSLGLLTAASVVPFVLRFHYLLRL